MKQVLHTLLLASSSLQSSQNYLVRVNFVLFYKFFSHILFIVFFFRTLSV